MGIFARNPWHPQTRARTATEKIKKDLKFAAIMFPPFSMYIQFGTLRSDSGGETVHPFSPAVWDLKGVST
jgi:hypothetical protein